MIAMLTYKNNKTSNLVSGGLWLVTFEISMWVLCRGVVKRLLFGWQWYGLPSNWRLAIIPYKFKKKKKTLACCQMFDLTN